MMFKFFSDLRKTGRLEAIDELLELLRSSKDSAYAHLTVDELIEQLTAVRVKIEADDPSFQEELSYLIAPTNCLQDTSYDNGWGQRFVVLAGRLDQ